jgi:hypothetical protein
VLPPINGGGGPDPCASLRLIRNIETPVNGVADQLVPGDTLEVRLRQGQPDVVVVVDRLGHEAGGIAPTLRLLQCLRQGVPFLATVLTIQGAAIHGAAIQVEVHPASHSEPCASLRLTRFIEAPVPGVADQLGAGDTLEVRLREGPPDVVVVVDRFGREAGGISPTLRLVDCLRQGVPFLATVLSIDGGAIQVQVQARQ